MTPSNKRVHDGVSDVKCSQKARRYIRIFPIGSKQVRLLVVKPGQEDNDINAILQVVDDDELGTDDCRYEALSYHEGEGEDLHSIIIINDECATVPIKDFTAAALTAQKKLFAKRHYVRLNLYSALKRLRAQDRHVALWVDALCTNQENDAEKTIQAYSSSKAMTFIKDVVDLNKLNNLLTDDRYIPQWAGLFQLLKWSWFSRRWVIQELALAQQASVHCGQSEVHWNDFKDAIGIFHRYFKSLQPRIQNPRLSGSPISDVEPLGAKLLAEMTSNLFRTKSNGTSESNMGLEKLVCQLFTFSTSDPRDTINCLRNLSKELNVVKTRSSSSPARESKSLDIICRHWALKEKQKLDIGTTAAPRLVTLPSWIFTTEDGSYGAGEAVFRGRKAGDSLVGLPGEAVYNASGCSIPIVQFGDGDAREWSPSPKSGPRLSIFPHDKSLTVSGYLIGKVSWSSPPIRSVLIPQQGLKRLGWTCRDASANKPAPDQLRRTLVAGRGPNGSDVPTYYSLACNYCLLNDTPNGDIDTTGLLRADESVSPQSIVKDYLERVRAVTSNRVILPGRSTIAAGSPMSNSIPASPISPTSLRTSEDLVGLGPLDTKEHDVIAILYGCSVPVILRRSGSYNRPQEFRFLGEAYIDGKMDAECMSEGHEEVEFVLR
ncbi:hypothetical protein BKA58DRAFT_450785 [Alternaria rosae]|uniref:uncharacterized protein n=1 Tax=Alternaria rosae TaxID=1187941 RepID=UPI001E8EE86C|nr:uncharacterized protein BKA58DRAFT_450785 [Alternaria rosae]KAH6851586.1 hypothetical protein BKA58DRAFT_450785 [Alternaria rosae]